MRQSAKEITPVFKVLLNVLWRHGCDSASKNQRILIQVLQNIHKTEIATLTKKQVHSMRLLVTGINLWHVFTTKLSDKSVSPSSLENSYKDDKSYK